MRRRIGKVQQDVSFAVGGWRFQTTECVPDDEPMSCLYEYLTDVQNPPWIFPGDACARLRFSACRSRFNRGTRNPATPR